ncbi:unnamed protein product [Cunninghamella blakesleeana]
MALETEKKKIKWLPLEANPDVMNKIIHENGIDSAWQFTDIYGFDPELLAFVPQPVKAIIFLYPITEKNEKDRKNEDELLLARPPAVDPSTVFFKQTISNACGMIAILHALANNQESIVKDGIFKNIFTETSTMTPDERATYLETCEPLASIHESSAHEGQTEAPSLDEQISLHFICFVDINGQLYELDGRKSYPVHRGPCKSLLEDATVVMRDFIERNSEDVNFNAIALSIMD